MLKILRYVFSAVTFLFALYGLMTGNFDSNHIMIFLLGVTMLIMGLEEFQKQRKMNGWLFVAVFIFSLYVSIQGFILS